MHTLFYQKLLVILFLISCLFFTAEAQPAGQGVTGFVYRSMGNQMPRIGKHPTGANRGFITEIAVFAAIKHGDVPENGTIFSLDTLQPVNKIKSDSTGRFCISLPPGNYSLFINTGQGWYADQTDGNGYVNHVSIVKNQWLEHSFNLRQNSAY